MKSIVRCIFRKSRMFNVFKVQKTTLLNLMEGLKSKKIILNNL